MFNENTTSNATENMTTEDEKMQEYVQKQLNILRKDVMGNINQMYHTLTSRIDFQQNLILNINNFLNSPFNATMQPQQFMNPGVNNPHHPRPPFNATMQPQQFGNPNISNQPSFPSNTNMHFSPFNANMHSQNPNLSQEGKCGNTFNSKTFEDINKLSNKLYNVNYKLVNSLQYKNYPEHFIEKLNSLIDELDMKFSEVFNPTNSANNS